MLKGISWGQFGDFILVVTCTYYMYIGVKYYGVQILGLVGRHGSGGAGLKAVRIGMGSVNETEDVGNVGAVAEGGQAGLFGKANKIAEGNELFKAMQQAIGVVRLVIAQGAENKLDRENLLDHIHEVLKGYKKLRGTDYAETINNYLVRVCFTELSLTLGEGDLAELWK